jgi:hypothetical protein
MGIVASAALIVGIAALVLTKNIYATVIGAVLGAAIGFFLPAMQNSILVANTPPAPYVAPEIVEANQALQDAQDISTATRSLTRAQDIEKRTNDMRAARGIPTVVVTNYPLPPSGSQQSQVSHVSQPAAAPAASGCLSWAQLSAYGTNVKPQEYPAGTRAGAQLTLNRDLTTPGGWIMHYNGSAVSSASAGQTVTLWSPDACRPLS